MLFNEKYAISYISYNTGRIIIEHSCDEVLATVDDNFDGLIRGFAKLTGGRRESLGMLQYRVDNSPFDFVFQLDTHDGIIITVEDMRKIDKIVSYIKDSLADINYNMLYTENGLSD